MTTKQKMEAALKAARAIAEKAMAERRGLTDAEETEVNAKLAEFDALKAQDDALKAQDEAARATQARFDAFAKMDMSGVSEDAQSGYLDLKAFPRMVKDRARDDRGYSIKGLLAAGSMVLPPAILTQSPVQLGKPANGLFDILPVARNADGDQYTYLRQTVRTNAAAPVAVGALKPTSTYTLERVTDSLTVIAHVTEPIPEFWLADDASLTAFLANEMGYGLQVATENQLLNGNGTAPNLRGLLNVSGIQTQTYATSAVASIRRGITKLETVGYKPSGIVMHPSDWETVELTTLTTTAYALEGAPVDRVAQRLWGVPVALSLAIAAGNAIIVSEGSASIVVDRQGVTFAWGTISDDFARNQLRGRTEGRFGLAVPRPAGIIKVALTA